MNKKGRRLALLSGGVAALVVVILVMYRGGIPEDGPLLPSLSGGSEIRSTWKNPVTAGEAVVPPDWKQTDNTVYEGALLTLTHKSGKSLVYINHEKIPGGMPLHEYVAGMEDSIQDQLGTGQFEAVDKDYRFYEAEGAELFGKVVVETRVRIWRSGGENFWESVSITDQDYKDLEYEALELVDLLMETTLL